MKTFSSGVLSLVLIHAFLIPAGSASAQNVVEPLYELRFERSEVPAESSGAMLNAYTQYRHSEPNSGLRFGWSSLWPTQFATEYKRKPGEGLRFDGFEWENKFQFTETGRLPIEIGLLAKIDRPVQSGDAYSLRFGPLIQKNVQNLQLNFNLLFERHIDEMPASSTELGYQWQAKYHWKENFKFGLQGFGDLGEWNDWAARGEQFHLVGPAVFGNLYFAGKHKLEYDAAYLTEPSGANRNHGLRLQLKYRH